jgi:hypothetical protein
MLKSGHMLVVAAALAAAPAAFGAEGGTASGHFSRDGVNIVFSHVTALSQDNAEGELEHPTQVRILLSDREVPVAALEGLAFPPVRAMARAGKVRGVLLEFDPADRTSLQATILVKPADPAESLANLSLSSTGGLWRRLDVSRERVGGELNPRDDDDLALSFDAPLQSDPVQADLKGAAVQTSEPLRVLIARAEAVGRGDLPAALALSAEGSMIRSTPPDQLKAFAKEAPSVIGQYKAAKRVVIRRDTAAVAMPGGGWASLVREGGSWKAAD